MVLKYGIKEHTANEVKQFDPKFFFQSLHSLLTDLR